ncbi:PR domain zinc finger protein 2-like [Strongylocentrotus purpuratus]|uniref:Uncharacterized protein n=1 Tax=Strongylocentrotus purpuratus TaxID=7668 RepID=A0A7M7NZA5_STRPU|nr:PR domain zinc finger protein 2-like [Strongylocentrotus purpuratus]
MLEVVAEGIKAPSGLEFRQSQMEPTLVGVWAKRSVRKGRTFGPFIGERRDCSDVLDDTYSWEIRGPKGVRLYSVDASEPTKANWMRYVKSARSFEEQNMIATQYKRSIYYRTLRPIAVGEELMCWYKNLSPTTTESLETEETEESDGALNTSEESITSAKSDGKSEGDSFDRQMPILEKMETSEIVPSQLDTSMSTESENRAKVPAHLEVMGHGEMDDKVAEPPLISPIYPSSSQHSANFSSITAGVDIGGVGESNIQIQEPDISSSDATSHYMASSEDTMEGHVDSTSITESKDKGKSSGGKKKSKAELKRQLKAQGGAPKKRTRVGQKSVKAPKLEGTPRAMDGDIEIPVDENGITTAVIGPDCVVTFPDGSEEFGCQFCPKRCRFPNGLKLHLMLKHHIKKITVEGVNTRKWGKGLGPDDIKNRKKAKVKKPENEVKVEKKIQGPVDEGKTLQEDAKKPPVSSPAKKSPKNTKKGLFKCDLCNRTFMYATWREKHLLRHKAEESKETFLCSDCPRRFVTGGDLTKHKLTHRSKPQEPTTESKSEVNVPVHAQESALELKTKSQENEIANGVALETSKAQVTKSPAQDVHSSMMSSSESADGIDKGASDEQDLARRRTITSRKGALKKVASCKICGIEFVSSSNLHRHLRKRHGMNLVKKPGPKSSGESDVGKTEGSGDEEKEPTTSVKTEIVSKPLTQESLLNVPKVNPTQTKGHMKTMANMTRMIRRKHATAVLQSMMKEKKLGGEDMVGDQSKIRAKLHAALRHGKNAKRKQGFKRIEQVASLTGKQYPTEMPNQICPWQNNVKPQPFVPKKPPTPQSALLSPGPSSSNVEVLDLRVKKPRTDGSQKQNTIMYVSGDSSQPLDLSCHSRPVVQVPKYKVTRRPPPTSPLASAPPTCSTHPEVKTITRFNITSRMKSTGWKSSTLTTPVESADLERPTKFSVLDAAITCNVCELPFDSMKLLTQHVVAHAEDFPYKCEFCVKLFETTDMLASHRYDLHRVGKMYCCSECQQEFAYLSNLKQHQVDIHSDHLCSYTERGPEEIRPQNFTDPTKAIQTPPILPEPRERISLIAHEMSKVSPSKFGRFSSTQTPETKSSPRKKSKKKKDVPCNPQRHHPFAYAREIGYLSSLPDGSASSGKSISHFEMATNNRCTKCAKVFSSTADLHVHIMECAAANAPSTAKPKTPLKTPVKTPVKAADKKKLTLEENKQKNAKARRIRIQAAKRSRNRALQKASESEESDAAQKRKRARPGLKMYNPLNHTRRRASANIVDVHACLGCGKQFHFINGLERHMKLCPNKDKLFNKNTNPYYAPRNMNHQCAYCARQFVYLRSLKKHISSCPTRPKDAPTSVPSLIVSLAAAASSAVPVTVSAASLPCTTVTSSALASAPLPAAIPGGAMKAKNNSPKKASTPEGTPEVLKDTASLEGTITENANLIKGEVQGVVSTAGGESSVSGTPRKARRRRRRLDPYGKKKKRSGSPRSSQKVEMQAEAEDEDEEGDEYEDDGEEEEEKEMEPEDIESNKETGTIGQVEDKGKREIDNITDVKEEKDRDSKKPEKLHADMKEGKNDEDKEKVEESNKIDEAKQDNVKNEEENGAVQKTETIEVKERTHVDNCTELKEAEKAKDKHVEKEGSCISSDVTTSVGCKNDNEMARTTEVWPSKVEQKKDNELLKEDEEAKGNKEENDGKMEMGGKSR